MNLLSAVACGGAILLAVACGDKEEKTPDTGCMSGICASGATGGTSGGRGGSGGRATGGSSVGGSSVGGSNVGGSDVGGSTTGGSTGDAGESTTAGSSTGGSGGATGGSGGATGGSGGATGGSSAGGTTGGANTGGTAGTSGCVEAWECAPWQTNGTNDDGTRTCTDLNACGTTTNKPIEAVTLPALDMNFYKCNVEPILDLKCAMIGCHGKEQGRALRTYARGRLRITGEMLTDSNNACLAQGQMFRTEDCIGSIECRCYFEPHTATEWRRNFDSARGFALDAAGNPVATPDDSDLIAQPIVGGKAHAGIHLFRQNDADHDALRRWLSGETLSTCNTNN